MVKEKLLWGFIKYIVCIIVVMYFNMFVLIWGCCISWWKELMYDKLVYINILMFVFIVFGIGVILFCNLKRNFFFNFEMWLFVLCLGWNFVNYFFLFLIWWNKFKINWFSVLFYWSLLLYKKCSVSLYIMYKICKMFLFNLWIFFFFVLIWIYIWLKEYKKEIDNEKKDGCKIVWFVFD